MTQINSGVVHERSNNFPRFDDTYYTYNALNGDHKYILQGDFC